MAENKRITLDWDATGLTVYCIIRREADNFRMDDANGSFAESPSDPYISLTEDTVIKGRYELDEARTVWNDDRYTVAFYNQVGGSEIPANDTIIGTGELIIKNDLEVFLNEAMRGTDNAALASICTETRLAELDSANMPTDLDNAAIEANAELHVSNAINNTIPLYERTDGTLTADGTEQTVYEVTPSVILVPDSITMSLINMVADDSVTINMYAKLKSGGAYELIDTQDYGNVKDIPAINITGQPNRYGWKVTLQQTVGINKDYDWERYTLTT